MATDDYRQDDQTYAERDTNISRRRRFGFFGSLGVGPTEGRLPDSPESVRPMGSVPTSGVRPDYGIPSQTHFPSGGGSGGRTGEPATGASSSRGMRRSRRGEFGGQGSGNVYNINFGDDTIGTTTVTGTTIGGGASIGSGNTTNVQKGVGSTQTINQGGGGPSQPAPSGRPRTPRPSGEAAGWAPPTVGTTPPPPPSQTPSTPPPPPPSGGGATRSRAQQPAPQTSGTTAPTQGPKTVGGGPRALGAAPAPRPMPAATPQLGEGRSARVGATLLSQAGEQSRTMEERRSFLDKARSAGFQGPATLESEQNTATQPSATAPAKKAGARKTAAKRTPATEKPKPPAKEQAETPATEAPAKKTAPKKDAPAKKPAPRKEAPAKKGASKKEAPPQEAPQESKKKEEKIVPENITMEPNDEGRPVPTATYKGQKVRMHKGNWVPVK